jgi:hypothetical protein
MMTNPGRQPKNERSNERWVGPSAPIDCEVHGEALDRRPGLKRAAKSRVDRGERLVAFRHQASRECYRLLLRDAPRENVDTGPRTA